MNSAQREAASTCCTDRDKGFCLGKFNLKDNWIWLVVVIVIFCCCSSGGGFFGGGDNCSRSRRNCNGSGGFLGGYWVLILLAVLCACAGGGIGGNGLLGGNQGNVNTNVINVAANEGYEEDDDYCC